MRWLCISDIHGDADALGAVLATAERHGYEKLLVAGDLCFPGPEADGRSEELQPLEVWRRLAQARAVCVQGVTDRAIATLDPQKLQASNTREQQRLEELARVQEALGELVLARLAKLDQKARFPLPDGRELLLVHGSPLDPTEPITMDMTDDEVRALLGDDPADIIVCGGSHCPFDRTVMGVRIVNVGSVGEALSGGGPRHAEATLLEFAKGPPVPQADGSNPLVLRVTQLVVPLEEERAPAASL